jgi:hypothetical protein
MKLYALGAFALGMLIFYGRLVSCPYDDGSGDCQTPMPLASSLPQQRANIQAVRNSQNDALDA